MVKNTQQHKMAAKIMKKGDIGKLFTRIELGIKPPKSFHGTAEYSKSCYMFFTICNNKGKTDKGYYSNELHMDGIVFEPDNEKDLVQTKGNDKKFGNISITKKVVYVFVRYYDRGDASFEYIGEATGFIRYDQKRNKVLIKPPNQLNIKK